MKNSFMRAGFYKRVVGLVMIFALVCTNLRGGAVVSRAATPSPGSVITSNQDWGEQTLQAGTYTINPGVTVTVSGRLTVSGTVTIKGGGKLVRSGSYKGKDKDSSSSSIFYLSGGTLNLENITVDGGNVAAYGVAVYIDSGTVNMKTDAVVENNINMNTNTTGANAAGGIYCGKNGTLNIDGGTIRNCRTSEVVGSDAYEHAGGGIYLKGTCNMTSGNITGNKASNGGGIYLASTDAVLRLSGGVISGNSAAGAGSGIYYSTLNAATSKVYIGGMANVKDIIYLDNNNGELFPYITSVIRYPVTLSCSSRDEGRVLAGGGDGYILTSVDASKISMTGTTLYSRLDKTSNQIYLSKTEEPEAMWQESAGGAWKQGRFTAALTNVYDGGTIKLLTAVVITEKAEITKAVTITSNDASAPCVMTRMPLGQWGNITINGGSLTLKNVIYDGNRDWIQGTEDAKKQSLIKVGNNAADTGASLTLGNGAVVRDGYKSSGSGVFAVYGTMIINDGAVIENCEVTGTGGGIWISQDGTFTMNGGTIRRCKAGGGGSAISVDGTCTLRGGSITGNVDSEKNCAVYLRKNNCGDLTMGGITIADNEYSVYNEDKDDDRGISVTGDSTLSGSIYTMDAIIASDKAMSSLTKTYEIMWAASPVPGTIVVKGSKDTQHYRLANTGYGLNPAGDGSSNLVVAQKYNVSFNKNGGSGTASDIEVICGGTYGTLPSLTRTGYTFDGWYTAATGGSQITAQTTVTATAAHTLYAHWTANTYTVTYNKDGGTIVNENKYKSYTYGTGLTLPTPTKTGYTFAGWYTSAGFSGSKQTSISGTVTGNKTYYAKWNPATYKITYILDGGTVTGNPAGYTIESSAITLKNPTKKGYTFTGWSGTDLTGSNNMTVTIAAGSTGERTYTAHWAVGGYTVTLHTNGGSGGTELPSYNYGTGAVLPTNWTKTGYTFAGWYDNEGCSGAAVTNITATDTGNKEYWAKWTDNIAPVIGSLQYSYQPGSFWHWLIGKDSLIITVPVTEEGSGADEITYIVTPEGGTAGTKTSAVVNGEAKVTVSADFKGTIVISCTDKDGNTSAGVTVGTDLNATGILIEDHAPQITYKPENVDILTTGEYETAPVITVTVTDNKDNAISSGIASVSYQIGNGGVKTVDHDYTTGMIVNDSFTIPASEISAGETVITVTAADHAGNTVTTMQTIKVHSHSGTLVPERTPACTTAGNKEYYTCTCGKWFEDSDCTNEIADHESVVKNALEHNFDDSGYVYNGTQHWRKCSRCDVSEQKEDHDYDDATDKCKVCGYSRLVDPDHTHRGTLIAANEPTCTLPGNIEYYFCDCEKLFSDSACTVEVTESEIKREAFGHDFGSFEHDQSEHWKKCARCGEEVERGNHVYDDDSDRDCNECGYERATGHTHGAVQTVNEKAATCTEDGNTAYYICSCGEWFSDNACTNEIANHASVVIGKSGHNFSEQYQSDESDHWKKCSRCDEIQSKENHIYDNATDKDCNVCGYERMTENPPEQETGFVSKDVEKGENVPDTRFATSTKELEDMLLTEAEKGQVESGTDIKFVLDVKDASTTVSSEDKAAVQTALGEFAVGQYLDIGLFKMIGENRSLISETAEKITIVIDVPGGLKNTDNKTARDFAVIRVHNGKADILNDLDNSADTITIATDRFSAYAIVYKDTTEEENKGAAPEPKEDKSQEPKKDKIQTKKPSEKETRMITLNSGLKTVQSGKELRISWGRVSDADGYNVYMQYCGKDFTAKSLHVVKSGKTKKITVKKINGKQLDTTKNYKVYVEAYKMAGKKKASLAKSITVHIAGKDSKKYTNVKTVQINKTSFTLKKGGSVKIQPKAVLYNKWKKQLSANHTKQFRFKSSNPNVATVSSAGKIKAKGTGECIIYIYARNGCKRKIKVKVK